MNEDAFQNKKYCLISETKTALLLYGKGMNDLRNLAHGLDDLRYDVNYLEFIHVPILLLSSSFERLIKCLLCLILMNERGGFEENPYEYKSKGTLGHDLDYLLNRLIEVITSKKYSTKFSIMESDMKYLREDDALRLIVKILTDFGLGARYYNLNKVLDVKSEHQNPINAWDAIEMNMLIITRGLDAVLKMSHQDIVIETQKDIVKTIEKFFGILRKLFELAGIENFAKGLNY